MEYYFKVIFDEPHGWCYLVRAKDVIEAGTKAMKEFYVICPGYALNASVVEIVRTDIDHVVT